MKYFLTCLLICGAITLSVSSAATTSDVFANQAVDRQTLNTQDNPEQQIQITKSLTSIPLAFTENQGQWEEQVLFRADAGRAVMWFTAEGAYYQFTRRVSRDEQSTENPQRGRSDRPSQTVDDIEVLMVKATFVGANLHPAMKG